MQLLARPNQIKKIQGFFSALCYCVKRVGGRFFYVAIQWLSMSSYGLTNDTNNLITKLRPLFQVLYVTAKLGPVILGLAGQTLWDI